MLIRSHICADQRTLLGILSLFFPSIDGLSAHSLPTSENALAGTIAVIYVEIPMSDFKIAPNLDVFLCERLGLPPRHGRCQRLVSGYVG